METYLGGELPEQTAGAEAAAKTLADKRMREIQETIGANETKREIISTSRSKHYSIGLDLGMQLQTARKLKPGIKPGTKNNKNHPKLFVAELKHQTSPLTCKHHSLTKSPALSQ
ncbi:MAG: hypothetical protein CMK72_07665 [Pseudomonadaceae bacterium]|nr:hypothetical protein [Pseudomonadaceae bacterium]HCP53169.1 hypothetical protein [Pseudomonas sp.]